MVPLGSLASIRASERPAGDDAIQPLSGGRRSTAAAGPGVSSATPSTTMEQVAKAELPTSMSFEWTDMAFLELLAGNTAMIIFGLAVVMVFLVLAAQYESWSLPLAVILVVPMCLLSAIIGVRIAQDGYQHFHAHRFRRAGRVGEQERDFDRRIRQAETRSRRTAAASDAGSMPIAFAADCHDVAGLHSRACCR